MEDYSPQARQDNDLERRQQQIPVDYDRRARQAEIANAGADIHSRLAVLEVKVSTTEHQLDETHKTTKQLVQRLDQHILQSTQSNAQLQLAITKVSTAVDTLTTVVGTTNNTLATIAETANNSHIQIVKWDAMMTGIFKVVGILAVIVSAAWTLYTFIDKKMDAKAEVVSHVIQQEQPSHMLRDLEIAINDQETK